MNKLYFLIILQLLSLNVFAEWQDPYDMNVKPNYKKLKTSKSAGYDAQENSKSNHFKSSSSEEPQNLSSIYMKRLVGFLLQYPRLDSLNDRYEASIQFSLSRENYDFLQEFVKLKQINSENLRKADSILEDVLRKSYFDGSQLLTLFDKLYFSIFNKTTMILTAMAFSIFLVYKCYCQQSPFLFLLKYLLLAALVVEFYVVYFDLLEEAEKQEYLNEKHCNTWNDFALSILGLSKCQKIKVTPMQVIQKIFHSILDSTFGAVGSGIGKYIGNVINDMPIVMKYIFGPIIFLMSLFLLIVVLIFLTNRQLNINLFHLIQFHVGKSSNESNNQQRRDRSIQMERPLIQAVENKKKHSLPKKIAYKDNTNKDKNKSKAKENRKSEKDSDMPVEKESETTSEKSRKESYEGDKINKKEEKKDIEETNNVEDKVKND